MFYMVGHVSHISLPLQSLDPSKRIGCEEMGGYDPLKQHPFFETISWSNLHLQTPPKLTPYLPAMSEDDEDCYGNVSCNVANVKNNLGFFFLQCNFLHVLLHSCLFPTLVRWSPEPVQQHAGGTIHLVTFVVATWIYAAPEVQQQHWTVHPRLGQQLFWARPPVHWRGETAVAGQTNHWKPLVKPSFPYLKHVLVYKTMLYI